MSINQQRIIAIVGGAACGKSKLRRDMLARGEIDANYHVRNTDDVMVGLPGYWELAKADVAKALRTYWPEANRITNEALDEAYVTGRNIVYEAVGGHSTTFDFLQNAKLKGCHVELHGVTTDFWTAHLRTIIRERTEGRHVRPANVESTQRLFAARFMSYAIGGEDILPLDVVKLWKSSNFSKDLSLIAEYYRGEIARIISQEELDIFLRKADSKAVIDFDPDENPHIRRAAVEMYCR